MARENRPKIDVGELGGGPLELTVITVPPGDLDGLLNQDIALIRAGILYADSISLVSPGAALMESVDKLRVAGADGVVRMMPLLNDEVLEHFAPNSVGSLPAGWRTSIGPVLQRGIDHFFNTMGAATLATPEGRAQVEQVNEMFALASRGLADVGADILDRTRAAELRKAIDRGLVTVSAPYATADPDGFLVEDLAPFLNSAVGDNEFPVDLLVGWARTITDILDSGDGLLLLDDMSSSIARDLQSTGHIQVPQPMRRAAAQVFAGTRFISRLPAFFELPIDELVDLRADLDDALRRYRLGVAKVVSLSKTAFSADWGEQADDTWDTKVVPAMTEIQDELTDHSLVKSLARGLATDSRSVVMSGSAIVSGVATWSVLNSTILSAASFALPLAANALATQLDRRRKKELLTRKDFYYLVEVNRRFSEQRDSRPTVID